MVFLHGRFSMGTSAMSTFTMSSTFYVRPAFDLPYSSGVELRQLRHKTYEVAEFNCRRTAVTTGVHGVLEKYDIIIEAYAPLMCT